MAGDGTTTPDTFVPETGGTDAGNPCTGNGLIAFYRFDEGQGTKVHDCTANQLDGTFLGSDTNTWTAGHSGTGIRVAKPNGCVNLGTPPALKLAPPFTITAWINVTSYTNETRGYIFGKTMNADYTGWRFAVMDNLSIDFEIGEGYDAASAFHANATGPMTGTWEHVAAIYDIARVDIYRGPTMVADGTSGVPMSIIDDGAGVRIGCRGDDSRFFAGIIDDVRVFNRALSQSEIQALAQ